MMTMKTKTITALIALVLAVAVGSGRIAAQSGDDRFQKALAVERADSNPAEAIKLYERIVKDFANDRALVARTLLRLGECYVTLGNKEAQAVFDRVWQQFPDQKESAAVARTRLSELSGSRPARSGVAVRPVATGDDADSAAFITADGRFLSRPDWNTGDLIVRDMTTGNPRRLMAKVGDYDTSDDEVDEAMLSPDNRSIAYVWCRDDPDQLRVMAHQPGAKSRTLLDRADYLLIDLIAWSPASDAILVLIENPDHSWQIAWVGLDGSVTSLKSLGWRLRGDRPSLSPDGKYVAYSALTVDPVPAVRRGQNLPGSASTVQHVFVLATNGSGRETELVRGASINESPVWTPDGGHLLFVSNRSGPFGLWSVDVTNGRVVGSPAQVRASVTGRISPIGITNGGTYYYKPEAAAGASGVDVFVANIDPQTGRVRGAATRLSDNGVDSNRSPAWSPDGTRIAFKRRLASGSNVLVVHDLATGIERIDPLYSGGEQQTSPIWFHNGYGLVVRASAYKGPVLRHVDLNTGRFEILAHTMPPENWHRAVLAADDRTLYVTTYDEPAGPSRGVARVLSWDLTTGNRRDIWRAEGRLTGRFDALALSADGRTLAAILQLEGWSSRRLIRFGVDGSGYRELATGVAPSMIAWTADGRGLIVATSGATTTALVRISAETGRQTPIGLTVTQPFGNIIDVSPDGSRIAYSDSTNEEQLWAIENLPSTLKSAR